METDDFWEEPHIKRWAQHVIDDMVPKVKASRIVLSLYNGESDVKLMVETGAAILLDKPIILTVFRGAVIPRKLRKVADEIVILENGVDAEGTRKVQAAMRRVMNKQR